MKMCHPEVPAGTPLPNVRTEEVAIELAGGEGMPALIAWPERTPAPAVLVINDVFGRSDFYEHLARRLAQAGFVACDPEFFFRQGALPEPTREAAMARRQKLHARLEETGFYHDIRIYPGLGHGFLKAFLEDERSAGYEQACASWTRTIAFYREAFGKVPAAV